MAILLFAAAPISATAQNECAAHAGIITTDFGPHCLHNGEATLTGTPDGSAVVPAGFTTVYILSRTNSLIIEQMGPSPNFVVSTVDVWRIHAMVLDPATLDLSTVQFGITSIYDVQPQITQGGGPICASISMTGAAMKTAECEEPCTAFASGMAMDSTLVCLVGGQATLTATPSGLSNVPAGYEVRYLLTRTNGLIIEQLSTASSFTVHSTDVWRIHNLVYDPATLDLGTITFGVTSAYDLRSMLLQGGGSICASLDINGAFVKTGECTPNCFAEAGVVSADQADVCLAEGSAMLSATPDGNATVPDGYELVYLLTQESGIPVILAHAGTPEFTVQAPGQYGIHPFVYDPATFDLTTVVPGETTLLDLNAQLQQGGGGICASLDMDGADFQVVDCSPTCTADAGTMNSETEVPCLGDGSAMISATSNGDTLVPPGFVMGYWLTQGSGLVLVDLGTEPVFAVSDTGLYHIHAFVFDPSTWDLSMVQLGETSAYELNLSLTQAGGTICASLDVLGAAIHVMACPPSCTAGIDAFISICTSNSLVVLLNALGGEPCPNGMWTTPNGNPFNGIFNPAIDPAGTYTYTVAIPFSAPSVATVTVNVVTAANAGASTSLVLCATDGIIDLHDALGGASDPTGTWMWGGTPFNGQFDPATMSSGVCTYTVTGIPPCLDATASVTILVIPPPNAGTDGEVTACIDGPPVLLFLALNGSPDPGGSWSGPSEVTNGVFNPATMESGIYIYTVLGIAPCASASAVVMVNVLECPDEFPVARNGNDLEAATTAVGEDPAGQPIGIWPNPATDAVNVVLPFPASGIDRLELTDATGRTVLATAHPKSANELTLDVRTLTPGVWTLRVTAVGQVSVGRFVRSAH
ncbi:MAG: T9SS type A sorting domain-containing protein [Flavobacteriales bacterium]|nr:T9SS type A sorting domain-containing protein [Flavobacteriales bacterium]